MSMDRAYNPVEDREEKVVYLTKEDSEEIVFALKRCYCDYDDSKPESWNRSIRQYNNSLDKIIEKVKF